MKVFLQYIGRKDYCKLMSSCITTTAAHSNRNNEAKQANSIIAIDWWPMRGPHRPSFESNNAQTRKRSHISLKNCCGYMFAALFLNAI